MCFNSSAAAVMFNDNADESCLALYLADDTFLFMGQSVRGLLLEAKPRRC